MKWPQLIIATLFLFLILPSAYAATTTLTVNACSGATSCSTTNYNVNSTAGIGHTIAKSEVGIIDSFVEQPFGAYDTINNVYVHFYHGGEGGITGAWTIELRATDGTSYSCSDNSISHTSTDTYLDLDFSSCSLTGTELNDLEIVYTSGDGKGSSDAYVYFTNVLVDYTEQAPPNQVALNTTNNTVFNTQTPTLNFTGTDNQSNDLDYQIFMDNSSNFDSSNITIEDDFSALLSNPLYSGSTTNTSQSFLGDGSIIRAIGVGVGRSTPLPFGNFTLTLSGSTGTFGVSSVPNGTILSTTELVDASTIPSTLTTMMFFNLTEPYQTYLNEELTIIVNYDDGNSTHYVDIDSSNTNPREGNRAVYSGGSWSSQEDYDFRIGLITSYSLMDFNSVSDSGFANQDTPADAQPFNSGDLINYTIYYLNHYLNDSYLEGNYSTSTAFSTTIKRAGQSFNVSSSNKLSKISVYLRKTGSPTGNMVMYIYNHSGTFGAGGSVTGDILATSNFVNISTLSSTEQYVDFIFPNGLELQENNPYVFYLQYNDSDASNYLRYYRDDTTPTANGNYFTSTGFGNANIDSIYKIYTGTRMPEGQYFWRVRANDTGTNAYGEWSETRTFNVTFETDAVPTWTNNLVVNDTAVDVGDVLNFNATGTDPEGDNYYLVVCDSDGITDGYPGTCTGNQVCLSSVTSSASEASCTNTTVASQGSTLNAYGFLCDAGSSSCSDSTTTTITITQADTCTYGGSGDWNIQLSDNCILSTTVDVGTDAVNLIGDAGSFTIDATGDLTCADLHYTPTDFDADTTFSILTGGTLSVE